MKNAVMLIFLCILVLLSCNNSIKSKIKKPIEHEIKTNSKKESEIKKTINPEFYPIILKSQFWEGGIQGAKLASSGLLMSEYFDSTESLDFIFKCKSQYESYFKIFDESKSSIKLLEENFDCNIFQVNMELNKNPENEFDIYKYVFPQVVRTFKLENGIWKLSNQNKINSFEELGELKYKTVFTM